MAKPMKGVHQKKGFWYARIGGREEYFGKGNKALKMAEAAKADEKVRKYKTKEVQMGLDSKRPEFKTFGQMCNWYMTLPSIQDQDGYPRKVYAAKALHSYFGNTSIYKIESEQQERFRVHRLGEGVGHHTINFEIQLLRAVYHKARKNKKISADIIPGEFIFKDYKNPRPIVPDDVFEKMVNKADNDFKGVLICGFESAMRASEIGDLTAGQVHLDEISIVNGQKQILDYIDLGVFDTKNKTRRTVPVSARLKGILAQRIRDKDSDDCIFDHNGLLYSKHKIKYYMKTVCEKAQIPYGDKVTNRKGEKIGIVFHCLRGTRITKWIEMGFSDEIIRRASGHKSLEAYREYVKLGPQSVMCLVRSCDKNATKLAQSL